MRHAVCALAALSIAATPLSANDCDLLVVAFGNSKIMRYDGMDGSLVGTFVHS